MKYCVVCDCYSKENAEVLLGEIRRKTGHVGYVVKLKDVPPSQEET